MGGQGLQFFFWGGDKGGGANSQQAHDVVTTSMRRNDVASTSFRRRVSTRFLINQCQIITFLILKYDTCIIENSRIELRGIVLLVQVGGSLGGGGGGKRYVAPPPLSNYWGAWPPALPPSSYAYVSISKDLTWNSHIKEIASKANQALGFIKRNVKTKMVIEIISLQTLVRPRLSMLPPCGAHIQSKVYTR